MIYDVILYIIIKNILLDNEGDGSGRCVRYRATVAAAGGLLDTKSSSLLGGAEFRSLLLSI